MKKLKAINDVVFQGRTVYSSGSEYEFEVDSRGLYSVKSRHGNGVFSEHELGDYFIEVEYKEERLQEVNEPTMITGVSTQSSNNHSYNVDDKSKSIKSRLASFAGKVFGK